MMNRRLVAAVTAGLASMSIGVSAANAQGGGAQGQSVTIAFATPPTRTITVVTLGPNGVVSTATAGPTAGTYLLPAKDFATGKAVEIWSVRCQDTRRVSVLDPVVALPANCEKRTQLGSGTWKVGTTLQATFPPRPGGLRLSPYALGGVNFTYTTGVSGVASDLGDLFEQLGAPNVSTSSEALDFGWQVGGGARLSWNRKIPAIDVSYMFADVGGPSVALNAFDSTVALDLNSQLGYRLSSLRFGMKFPITKTLYVTPLASYNWWKVVLNTEAALTVGGQPDLTDFLELNSSGSDWGFGGRVDFKIPALKSKFPLAIYGEVMVNLIRGDDQLIYGSEQLPPWQDHELVVFSVGVKYNFGRFRFGGNVQ
jgi:hypothetical protein